MRREKGYIMIVLVLVLLCAIGGVLFYLTTVKPSRSEQQKVPFELTGLPFNLNDELENWHVYTNSSIGLTLKHPPYDSYIPADIYTPPSAGGKHFVVSTSKYFNPEAITLCKTYEEELCLIPGVNWGKDKDIQTITVGSKSAISFFVSVKNNEGTGTSVLHVVQIDSPFVELSYAVDGVGQEEMMNVILSTVTFSE